MVKGPVIRAFLLQNRVLIAKHCESTTSHMVRRKTAKPTEFLLKNLV